MGNAINAGLFLIVSCLPFGGIVLAASPTPGAPALVITPPWSSAEHVVERHGGREILSASPIAGRVAVFSEKALETARADTSIWFLLDAQQLAFLCGDLS